MEKYLTRRRTAHSCELHAALRRDINAMTIGPQENSPAAALDVSARRYPGRSNVRDAFQHGGHDDGCLFRPHEPLRFFPGGCTDPHCRPDMARGIEQLMPVPDIALVEGLKGTAGGNYQMKGDFRDLSCIRLSHASNRRIRFIIWRAGRRPAFF